MYLHGRLALAELLIRLHDRCTCDAYGTCTSELIRRAAGAFGSSAALAAIFAHPSCSSAPAAALHRMIVPMVPRLPGLCTPTAPEDLITLRRPAIPCPATLPGDCQLDRPSLLERKLFTPTSGGTADSLTVASTPVILMGRAHQSLLVQTRGEPTVSGTVACCARDVGAKSSPVACECGFGGLAAVLRDN